MSNVIPFPQKSTTTRPGLLGITGIILAINVLSFLVLNTVMTTLPAVVLALITPAAVALGAYLVFAHRTEKSTTRAV